MTESQIQADILDAFKRLGIWAIRINAGKRGGVRMAPAGTPDIWTPWGWIEAKTLKGKLSDAQKNWHERARQHAINVAVVRSWPEAVEAVRAWQADGRR